jgi:signal peptidase II
MTAVPRSRAGLFVTVVAVLLGIDLATKSWAFESLGYEHRASEWAWETDLLWGRLSITFQTSFNRGALFGWGAGWTNWFAGLSLIAVVGILYWLFVRQAARSVPVTGALSLIAAGALGNLYDRLGWHGCTDHAGERIRAVRDFIDCTVPGLQWRGWGLPSLVTEYPWPIFNLADVFLVLGTMTLVLLGLRSDLDQNDPSLPQSAPADGATAPLTLDARGEAGERIISIDSPHLSRPSV